jgi:hypothetical protein
MWEFLGRLVRHRSGVDGKVKPLKLEMLNDPAVLKSAGNENTILYNLARFGTLN